MNKLKSMVIVVPELLPVPAIQGGAVEHWVDEISHYLATSSKLKLSIISRPSNSKGNSKIHYIGIPWTNVEQFFLKIKDKVTWRNPLRYVAKFQNVWSYGRRAALAVSNFDIIYLQNEPNLLLFIKKEAHQNIVLHMHNDHLSSRLFGPLYRRALKKVDKVIFVSDYLKRQAISKFPEYMDKFTVIHNATDPDVFKPYGDDAFEELKDVFTIETDKQYLLYVGRLNPVKGVHVLIRAFEKVHKLYPQTRLIISGSSFFKEATKTAYEKELVCLAAPLSDAILFTGYLSHNRLKYLYSIVDVVVFPSIWQEPFGLVMLEAMSSGTCVVASAVGGIPEVIENGKDGVVVEANDPALLSTAICDSLFGGEKAKMEINARNKIVDNFSWPRLVREVESIFGIAK